MLSQLNYNNFLNAKKLNYYNNLKYVSKKNLKKKKERKIFSKHL